MGMGSIGSMVGGMSGTGKTTQQSPLQTDVGGLQGPEQKGGKSKGGGGFDIGSLLGGITGGGGQGGGGFDIGSLIGGLMGGGGKGALGGGLGGFAEMFGGKGKGKGKGLDHAPGQVAGAFGGGPGKSEFAPGQMKKRCGGKDGGTGVEGDKGPGQKPIGKVDQKDTEAPKVGGTSGTEAPDTKAPTKTEPTQVAGADGPAQSPIQKTPVQGGGASNALQDLLKAIEALTALLGNPTSVAGAAGKEIGEQKAPAAPAAPISGGGDTAAPAAPSSNSTAGNNDSLAALLTSGNRVSISAPGVSISVN